MDRLNAELLKKEKSNARQTKKAKGRERGEIALKTAKNKVTPRPQQPPPKPKNKKVNFPPGKVIITCQPGLEQVLSSELTQLGIAHIKPNNNKGEGPPSPSPFIGASASSGSIELLPPISRNDVLRCHLYLGSASQILIGLDVGGVYKDEETRPKRNQTMTNGGRRRTSSAIALVFGELVQKVANLPWKSILPPLPPVPEPLPPQPHRYNRRRRQTQSDDPPDGRLFCKIKVTVTKSRLRHTGAISERIVAGINAALGFKPITTTTSGKDSDDGENHFRDDHANRAPVILSKGIPQNNNNNNHRDERGTGFSPGENNILSIVARFHRDRFQLWLDTSATPLHQRGYRLAVTKAPLREDLAFAMLYDAGWIPTFYSSLLSNKEDDQNKKGKGKTYTARPRAFMDPFCGSGTLAIEAASMKAGLAPGRLRPPPLCGIRWYDPDRWNQHLKEAATIAAAISKDQHGRLKDCIISCSDRDRGAIESVKSNALRAGVWKLLNVRCCAISAHPWFQNNKTLMRHRNNTNKNGDDDNDDDENSHDKDETTEYSSTKDDGVVALPTLETMAGSQYELLVATNPPFGRRLKIQSKAEGGKPKMDRILPLFQTMITRFEQWDQHGLLYKAAILTDNEHTIKRSGLQNAASSLNFSHGGIFVTSLVGYNRNAKKEETQKDEKRSE